MSIKYLSKSSLVGCSSVVSHFSEGKYSEQKGQFPQPSKFYEVHLYVVLSLNSYIFVPVQLFGPSMIPTFNVKKDGDLIITEHLSAQLRTIKK